MYDTQNNDPKIHLLLAFLKCGLPFFCAVNISGDINGAITTKLFYSWHSGNIQSTKKEDHILEMSTDQWGYFEIINLKILLLKQIYELIKQNKSKVKDNLQFVLLL